ncbi:EamA family transporter RarD [Endozoicomonas sp. Mp262]|uniref:EamA family transporter RarD n=1 Tax=Endozoicomonas sp. Mp262 TaxID=2919499 RepID=UPI0021DA3A22
MTQSSLASGLAYSVSASLLFGITPWYLQFLTPLDGNTLLWNRIIFSALFGFIALMMTKQWAQFRHIFSTPRYLLASITGTIIMVIQWWLFVWAPVNNHTTELSLGYFLLPLTLALTGRLLYKEKLSSLQQAAIVFACVGVIHEIIQQGEWPWIAITVAGLYPIYFILKRYTGIGTVPGFLFECLLFSPIAIFMLASDSDFLSLISSRPDFWLLLPGLGFLCSISFFLYIAASRALPVSLFGLLTYLEPTIIFVVAIAILKEPFSGSQWITYGLISIAAGLVSLDSIKLLKQKAALQY